MNVAVCDKNIKVQHILSKLIDENFHEVELELKIYTFSLGEDMIMSVDDHPYCFAFVDVSNDQGLAVAKRLRKVNPTCKLIFLDTEYSKVPDAFRLSALDYLLKPINEEEFKDFFDYLIEWYRDQNIKIIIPIRGTGKKKLFRVNDIKYVETYYNDADIVTMDDQHHIVHVKNRYKLRPALLFRWFIQVNQSVMVNMECIDFLTDRNVILKTREVFPLGQTYAVDNHLNYEKYKTFLKKKQEKLHEDSHS